MSGQTAHRLESIDAYRALVMLLMIFVNDTWTLIAIPGWIGHMPAEADGLGLADVVFPAFLFIVGLSIPLAIRSRLRKGDSRRQIAGHIALRSLALLIMGVFHVNLDYYAHTALMPKGVWQLAITVGFFLVWLDYPNPQSGKAKLMKAAGIVMLLVLTALFEREGHSRRWLAMEPHWWGILGLIGWSYFLVSVVFLYTHGKRWAQGALFAGLVLFNMGAQSDVFDALDPVREYIWIVGDGALPALTACGVVVSQLYLLHKDRLYVFLRKALWITLALVGSGLLARMEWNVSKIWATPSFSLLCAGISTAGFAAVVYVADIKRWIAWYRIIRPAGTSTLTCYLLPYIHYALLGFVGWQLPEILRTGAVGIMKSLAYALLIIIFTGVLERSRIRLKL
ncbi:DUF5009 domain-containing protein [Parapedobacter deserti]|uniref:DUF5009 domain-containing protein n=1 Tax=Parapedobacter deserti TaxID=1912957 RepID=A0ABV7JUF6_9SPHI